MDRPNCDCGMWKGPARGSARACELSRRHLATGDFKCECPCHKAPVIHIDPRIHRDRFIDRTNKPETCLYCGKPLVWYTRSGDGYDGRWCSLACARAFANAMVAAGYTLKPYTGPTKEE